MKRITALIAATVALAACGQVSSAPTGSTATPGKDPTPSPAMSSDDHTGDPMTYAGRIGTPGPSLESNVAAAQVMKNLSGEPQLAGVTTTSMPTGLEVTVSLTRNDDRVPDVWLAGLAVGAVAELMHADQADTSELMSSATAVGPGERGDPITSDLGVGAVRLGQVFDSPSDSTLTAHVADVARRYGLEVADLQILHPLEIALRVTFVVPNDATIDWTMYELVNDLVGQPPDVEGVLIELDDPDGQPLLLEGAAYRTGVGGLWFAPGQDGRFGAVHSYPPISRGP